HVTQVFVRPLPATLHWGQQVELRPLGQRRDLVNDLVGGLRADRDVAGGAVRLAQARVKDAQVVVDFGDGADGRTRALAGGLLLDADGRRQPADVLDLRLLELAEELAGVAGQRL